MARANTIQTNLTSGELSPFMYGRVDVSKYFNGARKLQNLICLPQGGAVRRPGTYYVGSVYDSSSKITLRPFIFSEIDSCVLEFSDLKLRIWQTDALVGAPLEVTTPWTENDLTGLRFAQSADALFITHPDYYPRQLVRTSATVFTLSLYANEDGPYMATPEAASVTLSNVADRATATAASAIFTTTGSTKNVSGATSHSNPGTAFDKAIKLTVTAHGYANGDSVMVASVGGVPESAGAWRVYLIDANNFVLCGSKFNPTSSYTSGGTTIVCNGTHVEYRENNRIKLARIIDIPSSSSSTATVDVEDAILYPSSGLKLTQFGDPTYDVVDRVVSDSPLYTYDNKYYYLRANAMGYATATVPTTTWSRLMVWYDSQTFYGFGCTVINFDDPTKNVTISSRTVTGTLTASAASFASTDVGRMFRLNYGTRWITGTITAYTSTTVVTVSCTTELPYDTGAAYQYYNGGITDTWKLGAWSETTGYPSALVFHQQRLVFAGTVTEPTTVWMTMSGDFYNFAVSDPDTAEVNDDSGITLTIVSKKVNTIRWLESGPVLLIGTAGSEWQVKPSSIAQTITPTNISATEQTSYGSENLDSYRVGTQTLFIERGGKKLRELAYDFSIDAFNSRDVSILSEHLLRENGGVVDWTVQTNPYSILWLVTGNGKLIGVTYEKEHDVVAWHQHDVSGTIESICTIPVDGGEDAVYMSVTRTINGSSVKYVEKLTGLLSSDLCYSDCYRSHDYGDTGIDTMSGLSHLEAEDVAVQVDGVHIGSAAVSGGEVHVGYIAGLVQVGIPSTAILGILDPEGGSQAGTSQGKKKRITESCLRVVSSYYFKTASSTIVTNATENLTASSDPTSSDYTRIVPTLTLGTQATSPSVGTVVPSSTWALVSGDIAFSVDDAFDNGSRFQIVQDEPYPLTVIALMHKLNTNE